MSRPTSRVAPPSRVPAALFGVVLALCVFGSASALVCQTSPQRTIRYVRAIEAPPGVTLEDLEPGPGPLEIRASMAGAVASAGDAIERARESVPAIPWGTHGLANRAIDLDEARYDETRGRYVVDLDGGAIAVLTFDVAAQRRLEEVVARYDEPGEAAVAIEPGTGRVLALVDDGEDAIGRGLATRAVAYAASTFKVITGAALLAADAVGPESETCYFGGGSGFDADALRADPARDTHCLTFRQAMAWSANIIFGRRAVESLDPADLELFAERFAYNREIPFEAPVERSVASLPVDDELEFARSAAGFRHTQLSPLHGAMIAAAIQNDGVLMVPALVERIESAEGRTLYYHEPTAWRRVLDPDVAHALRDTMSETATSGTARSYFAQRDGWPSGIDVFGKTGTLSNRRADGSEPDPFYTYTWFIGFAERGDDSVAVAGLAVNTPRWWIKGSYLASEAVLATLAQ